MTGLESSSSSPSSRVGSGRATPNLCAYLSRSRIRVFDGTRQCVGVLAKGHAGETDRFEPINAILINLREKEETIELHYVKNVTKSIMFGFNNFFSLKRVFSHLNRSKVIGIIDRSKVLRICRYS